MKSTNDHEDDRERITWGSFGVNGDEPLRRRPIKDLTNNHIYNILDTQRLVGPIKLVFLRELVYRIEESTNNYQEEL